MIPPTPTPMPSMDGLSSPMADSMQSLGTSFNQFGLWETSPDVVGLWNMFSPDNQILQWVTIGLLVIVLIFVLITLFKRLFGEQND